MAYNYKVKIPSCHLESMNLLNELTNIYYLPLIELNKRLWSVCKLVIKKIQVSFLTSKLSHFCIEVLIFMLLIALIIKNNIHFNFTILLLSLVWETNCSINWTPPTNCRYSAVPSNLKSWWEPCDIVTHDSQAFALIKVTLQTSPV